MPKWTCFVGHVASRAARQMATGATTDQRGLFWSTCGTTFRHVDFAGRRKACFGNVGS